MAVYYVMFNWLFFFNMYRGCFPNLTQTSMALSSDIPSSRFPLPYWLSYHLSVLTNGKISSSESPGLINTLDTRREGAAFSLDFHKAEWCFGERRTNNTTTSLKTKLKKKETRTKPRTHFSYDYVIFTRIYTSQSSKDVWNYEMSLTSIIKYKQ